MAISDILLEGGLTFKTYLDKGVRGVKILRPLEDVIYGWPLISRTWDDGFAGKVEGWGILRNGGDPSNGGMILKFYFHAVLYLV